MQKIWMVYSSHLHRKKQLQKFIVLGSGYFKKNTRDYEQSSEMDN